MLKKIFILISLFFISGYNYSLAQNYTKLSEFTLKQNNFLDYVTSKNNESYSFGIVENNKIIIVKDGVRSNSYDAIDNNFGIKYASNSTNMFFIGIKLNKKYLVKNNQEFGPFDNIYTNENKYVLNNGVFTILNNNSKFILKDSVLEGPFDDIGNIKSTEDNSKTAFSYKKDGMWYLKNNTISFGPYIEIYDITYSPDSRNLAFGLRDSNGYCVMLNGVKQKYYQAQGTSYNNIIFSKNSVNLYYTAIQNNKAILVKDTTDINNYDYVSLANFSPKGKYTYYMIIQNNKKAYVINGVNGSFYDNLSDIKFSINDNSYYYEGTINGRIEYIKDNSKLDYENISNFQYSPTGNGYSFDYGTEGQKIIFKDWVLINKYKNQNNLIYSINGDLFNYQAINGNNEKILVNQSGLEYINTIGNINYSKTGTGFFYTSYLKNGTIKVTINDKNTIEDNISIQNLINVNYNFKTEQLFILYKNINEYFLKVYYFNNLNNTLINNNSTTQNIINSTITNNNVINNTSNLKSKEVVDKHYSDKKKKETLKKIEIFINTVRFKKQNQKYIDILVNYKKVKKIKNNTTIDYIITELQKE